MDWKTLLTNFINALINAFKQSKKETVQTTNNTTNTPEKPDSSTNTTTTTPTNMTTTSTFSVGYFIDPNTTPLNSVNFPLLKKVGITSVYIRAYNNDYTTLKPWKSKVTNAGLKPFAWVWCDDKEHFTHSKEVAAMGYNLLVDVETYNITPLLPVLKQMRTDTMGKTFVICTKPDGWDGDQKYSELVKICDKVMPMTYKGDYNKTTLQLADYYNQLNKKYPNKFVAGLETYQSDKNPVAKPISELNGEISAVKPYVSGVGLFRLGLSNYGTDKVNPTTSTKSATQLQVEKSLGFTFNTFTEFYNYIRENKDYLYYLDDQFTFTEALGKGFNYLNCVDICQAGIKLARAMGYTATAYGIRCTEVSHAIFLITGKEFTTPTWIDLAAATSENYNIGYHWCSGTLTTEPGWIPYE